MRRSTVKAPVDPEAPHGRDDDGVPLAPYGLKADGTPRKSRRGATAGERGNNASAAKKPVGANRSALNATDKKRREALLGLVEGYVTMPLVAAGMNPFLERRIGQKHSMALAGDALIVQTYSESLADALIIASQDKPGILRWLDTVEEKAPWLMLAQVGFQLVKAIAGNHMKPDARLASAAVQFAKIKAIQYAAAVEQQAQDMGIPTDMFGPEDEDQVAA